jgi:hypothetical protein
MEGGRALELAVVEHDPVEVTSGWPRGRWTDPFRQSSIGLAIRESEALCSPLVVTN